MPLTRPATRPTTGSRPRARTRAALRPHGPATWALTLGLGAALTLAAPGGAGAATPPSQQTRERPNTDALHAAARTATAALQQRSPSVRVVWRLGQAGPQLVTGLALTTRGASAPARARSVLAAHAALLGGVAVRDLRLDHVSRSNGRQVVRFAQSAEGLPVLGRFVAVTLDSKGTVLHLSSDAVALAPVRRGPVTASKAARAAVLALSSRGGTWAARSTTEVVTVGGLGLGTVVHGWAVDLSGPQGPWRVVIRSADGAVHTAAPRARR